MHPDPFVGRDTYVALADHAPRRGGSGPPRWLVERPAWKPGWTRPRIVATAVAVTAFVAALPPVLQRGHAVGWDEGASRAAVENFFERIRRGETVAGVVYSCSDRPVPFQDWGMYDVAAALSAESLADAEADIGWHLDDGPDRREHDVEFAELARVTVALESTDGGESWRACGLLPSVALWIPD